MGERTAKDGAKFLKLCSPAGAPPALYNWPLVNNEYVNEAEEIVDTIRWVCHDFPDLKLAVENYILNDFDTTSYDSMKQLCDRYNKAITNIRRLWSGQQPPACIDAPPGPALLRHIMNQVYNHAIDNPGLLNQYEPFSPEVYGETSYELIEEVIKEANISEDDIFLDLGSGVGNVVLQVAAAVGPKVCCGVEKADKPGRYADEMEKHFAKWMKWYGKCYGEYELIKGDFLSPEFSERINSSTVIFVNNFAFGPALNHQLKLKFQYLPDGVRIISSAEFCPLNFRINDRNLSDVGAMMNVHLFSPLKGKVSWTNKPVSFYLQIIDRTLLEKYFYYKSHPEEEPPEELKRKLSPKDAMDRHGSSSEDNEEECKAVYHGGRKHNGRETPTQGWLSPAVKSHLVQELAGKLARQVGGFLSQGQPDLKKQIAKEMAHREKLQLITKSLEEEVTCLRKESASKMGACMDTLGLEPHTPQILLKGAKTIENRNKVLKKEVGSVEGETLALQKQFSRLLLRMQSNGLPIPDDLKRMGADGGASAKLPSRSLKESPRKMQLSQKAGHRRTPSNGLEQLLRVSELELLRTDVSREHKVERKDLNRLANTPKAGVAGAPLALQSRDEVLAAETLSSMATLGVESCGLSSLPSTHPHGQSLLTSGSLAGRTSLCGIDVVSSSTGAPFVVAAPSQSVPSHGRRASASEWNGTEAGHPITLQDSGVEDPCVFIIERVDTGRQNSSPVDANTQRENAAREDVPRSKSSTELLGEESFGRAQNGSSREKAIPPEYYPGRPVLCSQRSLSASTLATSSLASFAGPADTQLPKAPSPPQPDFVGGHSMLPSNNGQPTVAPLTSEAVGCGNEEEAGTLIMRSASAPDTTVISKLTITDAVSLASQPRQKEHRSRKRHSSDEKQFLPETKKSTVIHTDSSLEEYSSTTSSPAPTSTNHDTPPAAPPFSLTPLRLKPGETPPLMPYLPMMAVAAAQKGAAVPMIVPPSTVGPGYFLPPVSSVSGTQPSWPPFPYYWPVANTQVGQQQLSNSQMFSALDLQQPAQKQPGAQFLPFMQSMIPPVGGAALTPTSVAPPFFPSHPFLLPAQLPSATDPANSGSGISTTGSTSSWKVPTTSSATPSAGGASGPGFPFPVMGMMMQQQLALMKARGSSVSMHQPAVSMPSSPGGLMAGSTFPPLHHPPSAPGRGVPGTALNQEPAPSSGTASPSLPPAVFSPPFSTVLPQMIPSMLLTGTMAPPQVIQDVSCSGAAGMGNPSGSSKQNRSKPRYQRRHQRQPAQKADSADEKSVIGQPSGSNTGEPSNALPHPQPPKRHRGDKSATPRKYSRRQKDVSALKKPSIDEQKLQSLLNSVIRSENSTASSQSPSSVNGAAGHVQLGEREGATKVSNVGHTVSSNMDDKIDVTETSTQPYAGQSTEPMTQPSSTTESSKRSGTATAPILAQFSRTRSPNSLAEASSLLALSQPVTFSSELQEKIGAAVNRTSAPEEYQRNRSASPLKDDLQPEIVPECGAMAEGMESSQPCPPSEIRTARTPSLSAAEAMLMLTSDLAKVPEDVVPEDAPHTQEDEPSAPVPLEGKEHTSSDVSGEEGKPSEEIRVGTPLNDSELLPVPCDDGEAKKEVMVQSSLSQDGEHNDTLQPAVTAQGKDRSVDAGPVTPLTLDTLPDAGAEQSVAITKLLSPPESSPSVTDCPPHDIGDGLETVSSEEEQVESQMASGEEVGQQGTVEVVDSKEKSSVADLDSRGEPHQHEPYHKKNLAEGKDGSLPDNPAASTPEVACNGLVPTATAPTRQNPAEDGPEVQGEANNPQLIQSEVSCLQHSAPATEAPMAAPVQLLTPPLDRDQVFTCALPEDTDADSRSLPSHFKHHDSTRKHRNYRHSGHKEHSSSRSHHRRSLSPAGQRRERDRSSTERSAFHHSGSERSSSQHQADAKMSRSRSSSRDQIQDRLVSAHEGQEYHQMYHSHRDSPKTAPGTKHRHHDGQWGSRHPERYSQQNGHHQTQPRSSQWADRWRHPGTHPSSVRDAPQGDVAGSGGYAHKRRHSSSYSEHSSCDPVPKSKRAVS